MAFLDRSSKAWEFSDNGQQITCRRRILQNKILGGRMMEMHFFLNSNMSIQIVHIMEP